MLRPKTKDDIKKIISVVIILSVVSPLIASAQIASTNSTSAPLELPENFTQSKNFIMPILRKLPSISWRIFQEQVKPIWRRIASRGKSMWSHFWYSYLKPKVQVLLDKIIADLNLQIKKKEPQVEKNFQKQRRILGQEIQKQLPGVKKTIWQHIKNLLH